MNTLKLWKLRTVKEKASNQSCFSYLKQKKHGSDINIFQISWHMVDVIFESDLLQ